MRRHRWLFCLCTVVILIGLAAPAARPAPAGDFKIGLLLPYSGVFARLGESMTHATEMYLESIGWTAGGRKIVLIKEDEGVPNTDVAVRKFRKFVEQDRVDMVTGVVSSGSLAALVDPIREAKVITVISNAGFDGATREKKSPWLFRTSFSNWQIGAAQGEWAAKNLGKRAVTLQADYQVGRDNVRAFKDTFEPAGGRVAEEIWYPLGNPDFAPYLARVRLAMQNADLVYCFAAGADAVRLIRQWREFGMTGTNIICNGFMIGDDILPVVGDAAVGMRGALSWISTLGYPENRKFVADFRQKAGRVPDVYAAQAYETAIFIADALKKVNGDTSDQKRLMDVMKTITFKGPRGPFKLDPETQNIVLTIYIYEIVQEGSGVAPRISKVITNWKDPGRTK
ncbi:MAG: ABC transporter substrate-binding protein [Armatimonadota bacterium]